jgi:PAS domain S-box-containing protein
MSQDSNPFKTFISENVLPVIVSDRDSFAILEVNDAATRVYGYSREEFRKLTLVDLRPPEEVAFFHKFTEAAPAAGVAAAWRHRRKDGSILWVQVVWVTVAWEGRPARMSLVNDITATRSLAQDLEFTLEGMSDAFYVIDADWRFTYVNGEAERLLGRPRGELLGRTLWEVVPTAAGGIIKEAYERARQSDITVSFETYAEPLKRWFEVHAQPSDGRIAASFHDITEQRVERQARLEAEARFRLLSEVTSDAIWDWDLARDTIWWSPSLGQHFRMDAERLATVAAWRSAIHPDDRERVTAGLDAVLAGPGLHWTDEYRLLRADGSAVTVLDRGSVLRDSDGKAVRMVGSLTDQTARAAAQEQLREQATLLDHAQDAIVVRDLEHRVRNWNRAAEARFGWSRAEAVGQRVTELLYRDLELAAFEAAQEAVREKGEWRGELVHRARDGRLLTFESRWSLLRDDLGAPKSVLTINTDVTEKRVLEKQFLRAQRLESLGTLAGGIAHDLNNVLAPILMTASALELDESDPQRAEDLRDIHRAAQRGADIVKQLLSFARGVEGERMPVDLARLGKELRKIVRETFPKDITFELDIAPGLSLVEADATQIHQVLTNLCVNARDAMPRGGTLTVTMRPVVLDELYAQMNIDARPGPYVVITVADTGVGMAPHVLDHLFEPFFTTKDVGKGTGLGLSTAHSIIKQHGGFIEVESELGRGARFKVYLPAAEARATREASVDAGAEVPARGKGELVLVVDDEAPLRQVARRTLERFGYRALLAANGAEAVGLFAQHRAEIAVVLTDMMMPVMDGAATILALKAIDPAVRVVASSGHASQATTTRVAEAGVRRFVPKPYTAETLIKAIRDAIDEAR